jgi:hypothetical protein
MKICIFVNKSNHCSVNWTIFHFRVSRVQSYFFLKTCTSKRQGNMYMQKFILFFLKNEIAFFLFLRNWVRPHPCSTGYFR